MVIFLYGPDSYRLKQNSHIILDNYRKKHPGGVFFKFDLFGADEIAKVEDAVKSGSLFGGVKLIVLKNVFFNKADSDRIGDLIRSQNLLKEKDVVLLFFENQDESWALVNEIEKLCNFKTVGIIKKEDVTLLGFKKTDLNIFDFVDAIAGKNKSRAYEFLFKEIKNGRDPYYLLTMIAYGFRNLLTVKDLSDRGMSLDSVVKKTHLHPFVARKAYQSAEKFSLTELRNVYGHLLNMDTGSKEGVINLTDALFTFVLN